MTKAYTAFQETEPCKRCGEGESWTVKDPHSMCIGKSFEGEDAEANAEELAQMLNEAFEFGQRYPDGPPLEMPRFLRQNND